MAGLNAPATVLRDSHGVPAITTASPDDLFFAQGYVTAQDRLWQMDMSRRYAAGELAEVLGKDYLNIDIAQRVLGLRQVAETTVSRLSGRDRQYLESYARGVNAYISQHRRSLPLEFRLLRYFPRAWTPADSFLVGAMMSEMLNHYGYRDKLQREKIGAKLGPELTADLFPTTSGRDILPDGERPFAPDAAREVRQRKTSPNLAPIVGHRPSPAGGLLIGFAEGTGRARAFEPRPIGAYAGLKQLGRFRRPYGERQAVARKRHAPAAPHPEHLV